MNKIIKKTIGICLASALVVGAMGIGAFAEVEGQLDRASKTIYYRVNDKLITVKKDGSGNVTFDYGSEHYAYTEAELEALDKKLCNPVSKYVVKKNGKEKAIYDGRYMVIVDDEGIKYFLDNKNVRSKALYNYVIKNKKYTYCTPTGIKNHKLSLYKVSNTVKAVWGNTDVFGKRDILVAYSTADYWADFLYPEFDFNGHVEVPILKGESLYQLFANHNGTKGYNGAYIARVTASGADTMKVMKYKPKPGMLIYIQ